MFIFATKACFFVHHKNMIFQFWTIAFWRLEYTGVTVLILPKKQTCFFTKHDETLLCNFEPFFWSLQWFRYIYCSLTPNKTLTHTSFTYRKLNMDSFSVPNGSLGYLDSTQEVEWNSLHAQSLFQKAFFTS